MGEERSYKTLSRLSLAKAENNVTSPFESILLSMLITRAPCGTYLSDIFLLKNMESLI